MAVKKVSVDVKKRIQERIQDFINHPNWGQGPSGLELKKRNDEKIASYQAILDDTDFWHNADSEPQLLTESLWLGLLDGDSRVYRKYIFRNCGYIIKGKFTPEQEKLLVQDDFDSERRKFERLRHKHSLAQNTEPRTDRTGIPEEVRIAVWRRDNGQCRCGSRERLEYDHIIPVSRGGSNTVRNIELLCETCNRNKGANIQ